MALTHTMASLLYSWSLQNIMKSFNLEYSVLNIFISTYMKNVLRLMKYQHKFHAFSRGLVWNIAELAFLQLAKILSFAAQKVMIQLLGVQVFVRRHGFQPSLEKNLLALSNYLFPSLRDKI